MLRHFVLLASCFLILLVFGIFKYFQNVIDVDNYGEISSTPSTKIFTNVDTSNWEKHSGKGFFKFNILAPKKSYVCIGETAGESDCFPTGVYEDNMKHFPYGISFGQTMLDPNLDRLVETFNFDGYEPSDLNFDNASNQIMLKGSATKKFYDRNNNEIEKNVTYTRYLFTKDNYIYMPTIYTDELGSNYEHYQSILSTWKFE